MAVETKVISNSAALKLNSGTSASGTMKTVTVNLTGIKTSAFSEQDKEKVMNIADAFENVFEYPVIEVRLTTKQLFDED